MKLVIIRNPFNISDRVFISLGDDTTKTILEHLTDNFDEEFNIDDWHVSHNGFLIDQEQIRIGKLFHDDYLCVLPIVAKGGGGKNPLKILATIALTAVAFGGFGSIGGFFGKTMGKQLLLGAAMMLGGSLLSGVGKTPEIDMPGIEGSAWENSYEWDRGQPSDSQGKAIPVTYGTVRMQGGQIVSQHVSTNGDKQFLNLLLCGGEGPIDSISDVKINGNSIESLANVGDGSSDSNFTESLSATPVIKQTSSTCTGFDIEIKYPNGLYYSTTWSGTKATSHIHVEYKLNSDSTWISLFD
jgi:predicted phage tail protein